MTTNYITHTNDPVWLAAATAWIADSLDVDPRSLTLTPERIMPWAAVYRVESPAGVVYFKACAETQSHEPGLVCYLTERVPERVIPALAADPEYGRLLLPEGSTTIRDLQPANPAELESIWVEVMRAAASLQRATEADTERLLAQGVPDARFPALLQIYDDLLRDPRRLWVNSMEGLTEEEYAGLLPLGERLRALFGRAAAVGLRDAVVHEEAHDGHVFIDPTGAGPGRYRFFDWGDACIGHPFMWAMMPLRNLAEDHPDEPGLPAAVRAAYLEQWVGVAAAEELELALDAAMIGCAIARARTWVLVMDAYGPADMPEMVLKMYPMAVRYWLTTARDWLERHEAGRPLL